jgi:hypothetical protein
MATLSLSLEVSKLYKAEFYVQSKNTPMLISKLRALITNRSRTEEWVYHVARNDLRINCPFLALFNNINLANSNQTICDSQVKPRIRENVSLGPLSREL